MKGRWQAIGQTNSWEWCWSRPIDKQERVQEHAVFPSLARYHPLRGGYQYILMKELHCRTVVMANDRQRRVCRIRKGKNQTRMCRKSWQIVSTLLTNSRTVLDLEDKRRRVEVERRLMILPWYCRQVWREDEKGLRQMLCVEQKSIPLEWIKKWFCLSCMDERPNSCQKHSRIRRYKNTCSTSSPLHTTIVGLVSLILSSSPVTSLSSRYRGTTNSNSHVHFSHRLSKHGTQHLAESGEEGVVYAWGTRLTNIQSLILWLMTWKAAYKGMWIIRQDELKSIDRIAQTVGDVDGNRRKLRCCRLRLGVSWCLRFWGCNWGRQNGIWIGDQR